MAAPMMASLNPKGENLTEEFNNSFGQGEMLREPIFYGGSGAYDHQYLLYAPLRYKNDENWIQRSKGFTIQDCVSIASYLKDLHNSKFSQLYINPNLKDFSNVCLEIFSFDPKEISEENFPLKNQFISEFSVTPGMVNTEFISPGQYNVVEYCPIIKLPNGKYFFPMTFDLAKSIYESPYYWMLGDEEYLEIASQNKGLFVEDHSEVLLKNVFGNENVWKNVVVLEQKGHDISEIDVLAIIDNKALIIQAKSKKLTIAAKLGSDKQIQSDFKKAVQEAYEQGILCRRALLNTKTQLRDLNGGKISIPYPLTDVFIVCVTGDHYPAVDFQKRQFLKTTTGDPGTLAISLFDLDVICHYLTDPVDFIFYVRQRSHTTDYFLAEEELQYLGFHLKVGLSKLSETDFVWIQNDFADDINRDFSLTRFQDNRIQGANPWGPRNSDFEKIIDSVKQQASPGYLDLLFFLMQFTKASADELIEQITEAKNRSRMDGNNHDVRLQYKGENAGVTYLCYSEDPLKLGRQVHVLGVLGKYKSKADRWIAMGSHKDSDALVEALEYIDEPWKQNKKLDEVLPYMKAEKAYKGKVKIGRNSPCPCQSGKKFKHCCGGNVPTVKR